MRSANRQPTTDIRQPLHAILVADFSRVLAGPLCTQMLADAGARVIKIEEPERGDETRRWGPPFVGGVSAYFLSINRNKESIALDLRSAAGRRAAKQLIERADVVVDNFLPSQRRALGLGNVKRINPRAIHCSIGGYDSGTPEADRPGYDLLAQAASGLMSITGEPDGDPMKVGVALSDVLTAHHAVGAINAALFARERSGRGARIEISLFGATVASLVNVAQNVLVTGKEARRMGNDHPSIVPYQLFHGSDRPLVLAVGTDRHFARFCAAVIGMPKLADDPRFATNAARVEHRDELAKIIEKVFRTRRASHWIARCRRADVPAALVQGVREALRSPAGREIVVSIDHPSIGAYDAVANPLRIDGKRLPVRSAPPAIGQHTAAILRELGWTAAEIREVSGPALRDGTVTRTSTRRTSRRTKAG